MSFTLDELEALMFGGSTTNPTASLTFSEPDFGISFGDSFGDTFSDEEEISDEEESSSVSRKRTDDERQDRGETKKLRGATAEPMPKLVAQPQEGICEVCGDNEFLVRCSLASDKPCPHMFCEPCLSKWIATQVEARNRVIVCPAEGCGHQLSKTDIARLSLDPAVPVAHSALMAETYEDRLAEMSSDPELKAWMDANARPCPKCSVLITRTSGCNAVKCPCGHRFCYCCGQERCVNRPAPVASAGAFHALLAQQAELWREAKKQGRKINPFTGKFE
jgi:hypothetical protein